jgi:hypothetical protein
MAVTKFTDAQIFLGNYNVSGKHNQVSVDYSAEMLDATAFGATTRQFLPGVYEWSVSGQGWWEVGAVSPAFGDHTFFSRIGASETPLTVAPANTDGGTAFFGKVVNPTLNFFGAHGELAPFTLDHQPGTQTGNYLTRGYLGFQPTQRAASANGTYVLLGSTVSASQRLAAILHVIQFTGTSLDVVIESDDNSGFSSATSRIAFTQATGLTSEWKDVAGPIATDTYFRVKTTFVGTNFTALVCFGVASAS